jgi:hypothetical protein
MAGSASADHFLFEGFRLDHGGLFKLDETGTAPQQTAEGDLSVPAGAFPSLPAAPPASGRRRRITQPVSPLTRSTVIRQGEG